MRKAPALQVEEISGDKFPDRDAAQDAARPFLSDNLLALIQDLLERGELVNDNGKIIPNPHYCKHKEASVSMETVDPSTR